MPGIRYQDGASLRDFADSLYQDGSALRALKAMCYQDGANLRVVWQAVAPLDGSVDGGNWYRPASGTKPTPVTVGQCTAYPSGGGGSYTYAWSVASPDAFTLLNTSSKTVTVRHPVDVPGVFTGTIKCRISDGSTYVDRTASIRLELI